jgi:hypothetical protein
VLPADVVVAFDLPELELLQAAAATASSVTSTSQRARIEPSPESAAVTKLTQHCTNRSV